MRKTTKQPDSTVDLEARLAQLEATIVRLKTSETERLTVQRDIALRLVRDALNTIDLVLAGKMLQDGLRNSRIEIEREMLLNFRPSF